MRILARFLVAPQSLHFKAQGSLTTIAKIYESDNYSEAIAFDLYDYELEKSSARRVHLKELSLKSRGLYRCEVSKEAPSFHSAQAESFMEVYFFPRESPRITGHERPYGAQEPLQVNCSSAHSFPAPDLQWHIDGQKVKESSWLIEYGAKPASQGLLVSTLGLRAPARPLMQLSCVAMLGSYRREKTVVIETNSSSLKKAFSLFTVILVSVNIRIYDKIL